MKLKPFDLEAAKAGAPVVTADGRPVRIVDFEYNPARGARLIGVVIGEDGVEVAFAFDRDGKVGRFASMYAKDLRMVVTKQKGWVNIYKGPDGIEAGRVYSSESEARSGSANDRFEAWRYVGTAPVEWEE